MSNEKINQAFAEAFAKAFPPERLAEMKKMADEIASENADAMKSMIANLPAPVTAQDVHRLEAKIDLILDHLGLDSEGGTK